MEDVERFHELRLAVRRRKLSCDGNLTDGHAGRGWANAQSVSLGIEGRNGQQLRKS